MSEFMNFTEFLRLCRKSRCSGHEQKDSCFFQRCIAWCRRRLPCLTQKSVLPFLAFAAWEQEQVKMLMKMELMLHSWRICQRFMMLSQDFWSQQSWWDVGIGTRHGAQRCLDLFRTRPVPLARIEDTNENLYKKSVTCGICGAQVL